jgi:hypothetical protein
MCNDCNKKRLAEISTDEKIKLKNIINLVNQGKVKEALQIAETLSTEARDKIPDSVLFKFSILEEMSATGGSASFQPGTGLGVASKMAFKKKVKKPKYFQKHKNKAFKMKLSSMLNEIKVKPKDPEELYLKAKNKLESSKNINHLIQNKKEWDKFCVENGVDPKKFYEWRLKRFTGGDIMLQKYPYTSLQEGISYNKFKNSSKTKSSQQTLHTAVKEIKKRLSEVNKILEYTHKMRTELSEDQAVRYSKFTEQALNQITGMVAELYGNVKKLKK